MRQKKRLTAYDLYEMLVGEYGFPRREFLYDIRFWEVKRILKGCRKRRRLEHQLLRLNAYMSCFSMRENKERKTPEQWLPLPWEKDLEEDASSPLTEEDRQELQALMDELNGKKQDGK